MPTFDSFTYLGGIESRVSILLHVLTIADEVVEPQLALPPTPSLRNWPIHSPTVMAIRELPSLPWYVQ